MDRELEEERTGMKTPPLGTTPLHPCWTAFTRWASTHSVPDETEDWLYLWDCWQQAWLEGREEIIAHDLAQRAT